jgi:hypothetical protein
MVCAGGLSRSTLHFFAFFAIRGIPMEHCSFNLIGKDSKVRRQPIEQIPLGRICGKVAD